jgi:RimJ/RimL family protein N-acetyltransferase
VTDPRNYEAADRLKDGTPVVVRAIRHDDAAGVLAAFKSLDPQSVYTRFFTYKKGLTDAELKQITDVDFDRVVALVVALPRDGEEKLIGGGRYFADLSVKSAELAFVTDENYRGQGIASLILRHLARIGRDQGVLRLEADVLAQNQAMLAVFRRSGLPTRERPEGNVVHVTLSLDPFPPSTSSPTSL